MLLIVLNSAISIDNHILGKVILNLPYFIFGVMLKENKNFGGYMLQGNLLSIAIFLATFLISYLICTYYHIEPHKQYYTALLFGLLGALLVINVSKKMALINAKIIGVISSVGFYSMTIYLFHTLFESAVRIFFYQVVKGIQLHFLWVTAIAVVVGILFPLLLEKLIFRRYALTKKYLLGI